MTRSTDQTRPTKARLSELLDAALRCVHREEGDLPVDAHERTWCAHLACRLARAPELAGWSVDVEYNREGLDPKRRESGATVLPDLVVHRRGTSHNLLAIEAKPKRDRACGPKGGVEEDVATKLVGYARRQRYGFVALVTFDGQPPLVWSREEAVRLGCVGIRRQLSAGPAPSRNDDGAFHAEERAESWAGIRRFGEEFCAVGESRGSVASRPEWVFRGHRGSEWPLESTLDRVVRRWPEWASRKLELEAHLLREFHRRARVLRPELGAARGPVEWLAWMQHFGGPTRLLDFTYSFWVALFFAVESAAQDSRQHPCVWAIDQAWLQARSLSALRHRGGGGAAAAYEGDPHALQPATFQTVYRRVPPIDFILPQNSYRLHERLAVQAGVFHCPGNVQKGFDENLRSVVGLGGDGSDTEPNGRNGASAHIRKLLIDAAIVPEALRRLRAMNITAAVLFPDLEGFARSLSSRPAAPPGESHHVIDPWDSLIAGLDSD